MNIRYFGGPQHNKIISASPPTYLRYIELIRHHPKQKTIAMLYDYNPSPFGEPFKMQRGKYYMTDESDKHGNVIYCWSGWR